VLIVVAPPPPDLAPGVVEVFEDLGTEALVAEAPLEGFDEAIFGGFAGCREVESSDAYFFFQV
jgi:hypothetical protein